MVAAASGASALGYARPNFATQCRNESWALSNGGRDGKAATTLMVGAASGASALGYAPANFATQCRNE